MIAILRRQLVQIPPEETRSCPVSVGTGGNATIAAETPLNVENEYPLIHLYFPESEAELLSTADYAGHPHTLPSAGLVNVRHQHYPH